MEVGCAVQCLADDSRERLCLNFGGSQRLGEKKGSGRL